MKVKTKKYHGMLSKEVTFKCQEQDPDSPENITDIKIEELNRSIFIKPKGYGDSRSKNGHGSPIMIERYEGKLRIVIWGDIMTEDPTHIINIEGAREDRTERLAALKGVEA